MSATITGIRAQHPGKCQICNNTWEAGALIERIPGTDPVKRGHAECVANLGLQRPQPAESYRQHTEPLDNGNGATHNSRVSNFPNGQLAEAMYALADAMTAAAQAAMGASVAAKRIAESIDPHGVTRERQ